jgi:hypothetical protein
MYEHELKSLIEEEVENLKEKLAAGLIQSDEYKHYTGRIAGLRAALDLMDEAERVCNHKAR